jgi:hypothetical protein
MLEDATTKSRLWWKRLLENHLIGLRLVGTFLGQTRITDENFELATWKQIKFCEKVRSYL